MDMSKLPKFSQTPVPPPVETSPETPPTPVAARPVDYGTAAPISGGEVWFSVIVGLIFLLLGRGFGGYAMAKLTHQAHHTGVNWSAGPKAGQEVAYPELEGGVFLNDSAMFLFGAAIVADALIHLAVVRGAKSDRTLAYVGFTLTVAAVLYNLYVAGVLLKGNVLPLLSLLAVAFGGYAAFQEWQMIQALNRRAQ